jgi:hypothetical protein
MSREISVRFEHASQRDRFLAPLIATAVGLAVLSLTLAMISWRAFQAFPAPAARCALPPADCECRCIARVGMYGVRDAACPLSTRGGTRLVRLVRGGGKGGGGDVCGCDVLTPTIAPLPQPRRGMRMEQNRGVAKTRGGNLGLKARALRVWVV